MISTSHLAVHLCTNEYSIHMQYPESLYNKEIVQKVAFTSTRWIIAKL